jgi:hypothetical protein
MNEKQEKAWHPCLHFASVFVQAVLADLLQPPWNPGRTGLMITSLQGGWRKPPQGTAEPPQDRPLPGNDDLLTPARLCPPVMTAMTISPDPFPKPGLRFWPTRPHSDQDCLITTHIFRPPQILPLRRPKAHACTLEGSLRVSALSDKPPGSVRNLC